MKKKKASIVLYYRDSAYLFGVITCEKHDGTMYDTQEAVKAYLEYMLKATDITFQGGLVHFKTGGDEHSYPGSMNYKTFMEPFEYQA